MSLTWQVVVHGVGSWLEKDDNVPKIIVHCKQISEPVTTTNFGSKHDRLQFTILEFNFSQLDRCTRKSLVKGMTHKTRCEFTTHIQRCTHTHTHGASVKWLAHRAQVPMKRLQWIKQSSLPRLPCSEGMSGSLSTIRTSELNTFWYFDQFNVLMPGTQPIRHTQES